MVTAFAPGRVNLIGDHTDYTGGWVLPMAIQLGTTVEVELGGRRVRLLSESEQLPAELPIDITDPGRVEPPWARYVAGVVAELRPRHGASGTVTTTLPVGAGLSSSAALEVAVALALGFEGRVDELAHLCQQAEQRASGVPCGIMDQLASAGGVEGCALLIDCSSEAVTPVPIPEQAEVVVVHSGEERRLAASGYATRRAECEQAQVVVGPLCRPDADLDRIDNGILRRRARHVINENQRVLAAASALRQGDLGGAGALMYESHVSLRDDFEVSTPGLDQLVEDLRRHPRVYGARLTGAGFGGCVVALTEPGALATGWKVHPSAGARLVG
jgi:galactokinase